MYYQSLRPASNGEIINQWTDFLINRRHNRLLNSNTRMPLQAHGAIKDIIIPFDELEAFSSQLAQTTMDEPRRSLYLADKALRQLACSELSTHIHVVIDSLPLDTDEYTDTVTKIHDGKLTSIIGRILDVQPYRSRLLSVIYECRLCGRMYHFELNDENELVTPGRCSRNLGGCGAAGQNKFRLLPNHPLIKSTNIRKVLIQVESPSALGQIYVYLLNSIEYEHDPYTSKPLRLNGYFVADDVGKTKIGGINGSFYVISLNGCAPATN